MKNFILSSLVLSLSTVVAHADLDWGGGQTQFANEAGTVLNRDTGCAVLVSVRSGELIDFETFIPESPADLVTPGSVLSEGSSVNSVLAASCEFYSGYLLNSAIPDLLIDEQELLGVASGEDLYVVVWDVDTFENGRPTDDSFFTVLPLYFDGAQSAQAQTSGDTFSIFTNRVHPVESLESEDLLQIAQFGGFNTFAGFSDWAESNFGLADGSSDDAKSIDSSGNGRSNYEEYIFGSLPRMGRAPLDGTAPNRSEVTVTLRANDPSLAYSVNVSEDLSNWGNVGLDFTGKQWVCSNSSVQITSATYKGAGVWSLGLVYADTEQSSTFFRFHTAIN